MLFPLDNAFNFLSGIFPDLRRTDASLTWTHWDGRSELVVEPVAIDTRDGLRVQERVTLTHTRPGLATLPTSIAGRLNKLATLSALIPAGGSYDGRMVCKTGIFEGDTVAAEEIYAPLICMEAAAIGWHAMCLSSGSLGPLDAEEKSPWSGTNAPPPYSQADFEAVKNISDRLGLLGSISEGAYTVEFPWDPGSVSQSFAKESGSEHLRSLGRYSEDDIARMGGRTGLLWIRTNEKHSLFGNGVLATLELPLPVEGSDLSRLVDELNRWELSGDDLPPLFGAWCIGSRAPTFVTFLPNQLCLPNIFLNLFHWSRIRHTRAREWIEAAQARH